jgi:predicted N-acetyltransferase YhbS
MVAWAEAFLAEHGTEPGHVETPVMDYDAGRQRMLAARGWRPLDYGGRVRRVRVAGGAPAGQPIATGYDMRTTSAATIEDDAARMATLLNAAFGRTIHTAAEYLAFSDGSPSFRHDLNLVAVAPDGAFAAHVGLTLDEENRLGIVEPVCTHPDHRRRGLAAALLFEGLRRLRSLGAELVHVESGDAEGANAFYDNCGFTERYDLRWWRFTG